MKHNFTHTQEFLSASRRSTASDSARTKGGTRWGPSPFPAKKTWRGRRFPPSLACPSGRRARILRYSRLQGWRNSWKRKFVSPNAIGTAFSPTSREALATGRIGFAAIRNLTSGRWKTDGPSVSFDKGERRKELGEIAGYKL